MDSCCASNEWTKPLLNVEEDVEVAVGVPMFNGRAGRNELDVTYHVNSICRDGDESVSRAPTTMTDGETGKSSSSSSSCTEDFIMWVILPALLFSQFGMAFLMHDERTTTMSWAIVNLCIVLFVVTACLYRHACKDAKVSTIGLLLLPEILMDIVLGLVLFNQVALGFMVLLVSMLLLATFVVASSLVFLYSRTGQSETDETEESSTTSPLPLV